MSFAYKTAKTILDEAQDRIKQTQTALMKNSATLTARDNLQRLADKTLRADSLFSELVTEMIDKVKVFPYNRVEIIWKSTITEPLKC